MRARDRLDARPDSAAVVLDLRRLYEEQADFVRRAVIHLGGPRHDVDDLVQEVFLVALRKSSAFEGRAKVTTWLYAIAMRVVAGARRRARIRALLPLLPPEPELGESPADTFEHRESSALVYRLLDKISEKKRSVFILYELSGLPGEEIAEIVRCPLKTVWTRLHHARLEFSALLRKHQARMEHELRVERRRA